MILVNPDKIYNAVQFLICEPYLRRLRAKIDKQTRFRICIRVVYVCRKILCATVFKQSAPMGGVFGF